MKLVSGGGLTVPQNRPDSDILGSESEREIKLKKKKTQVGFL